MKGGVKLTAPQKKLPSKTPALLELKQEFMQIYMRQRIQEWIK